MCHRPSPYYIVDIGAFVTVLVELSEVFVWSLSMTAGCLVWFAIKENAKATQKNHHNYLLHSMTISQVRTIGILTLRVILLSCSDDRFSLKRKSNSPPPVSLRSMRSWTCSKVPSLPLRSSASPVPVILAIFRECRVSRRQRRAGLYRRSHRRTRRIVLRAEVVGNKSNGGAINIGCKVTVTLKGKEHTYEIVGEWEADPLKKKISHTSPLGLALVGKKKGENVEFEAPAGKVVYQIKKIH